MALRLGLLVAAYLLGTFPTAILVGRVHGRDVVRQGSGNPGASNVYRLAGWRAAALVFAGDLAKGALAAGAGWAAAGPRFGLACGLAAVFGHCYPATRPGRGGKGVATAGGVALVLYPIPFLLVAMLWGVVARVSGTASLASLAAAAAAVAALVLGHTSGWEVAGVLAMVAVVVARHGANLSRLVRGREGRLDRVRDR